MAMYENAPRHDTSIFWVSPLYGNSGWYFKDKGDTSHGPYPDFNTVKNAAENPHELDKEDRRESIH
jgi:hypothetical protein